MGDYNDRGELADIVPDTAIWICAVLPTWGCTKIDHDRTDLPRRVAIHRHPSRRITVTCTRAGFCDDRAKSAELNATAHWYQMGGRNAGRPFLLQLCKLKIWTYSPFDLQSNKSAQSYETMSNHENQRGT